MLTRLVPLVAALALLGAVPAAADGPHPQAPPQTAEYAFLVGTFACTQRVLQPDGSHVENAARWSGRWVLGGWALQDEWIGLGADGPVSWGTNLRSFDRERGVWNNRWLASGGLRWVHFDSRKVGDTMVMVGGGGRDRFGAYVDRNTFHAITPEGFEWRKDRSYDGGVTWLEGVARISARRIEVDGAG